MAANDELTGFVKEALAGGSSREEIRGALARAGWSDEQVRSALSAFAEDIPFPVPVPRPRPYTDAREVFVLAVLFGTMYLTAFNAGALAFVLIDIGFPPPVPRGLSLGDAVRGPVSLLVVALPVFLYLTRLTAKEFERDPSKRISPIRRKLTFLTLFICAAVLIGVLAGVIYEFLGDEITAAFILKALTASGIAAAVFGHYLRDTRSERSTSDSPTRRRKTAHSALVQARRARVV